MWLNCKVIKSNNPPISASTPPPFQVYTPFLAKNFVSPPIHSIFRRFTRLWTPILKFFILKPIPSKNWDSANHPLSFLKIWLEAEPLPQKKGVEGEGAHYKVPHISYSPTSPKFWILPLKDCCLNWKCFLNWFGSHETLPVIL